MDLRQERHQMIQEHLAVPETNKLLNKQVSSMTRVCQGTQKPTERKSQERGKPGIIYQSINQ